MGNALGFPFQGLILHVQKHNPSHTCGEGGQYLILEGSSFEVAGSENRVAKLRFWHTAEYLTLVTAQFPNNCSLWCAPHGAGALDFAFSFARL